MDNQNLPQQPLPNATAVLVLGICSIVVCGICGIIALVLGNSAIKMYDANPSAYTPGSLSNVKAGKVCSIIGLCLMVVGIIIYIAVGSFFFVNRHRFY